MSGLATSGPTDKTSLEQTLEGLGLRIGVACLHVVRRALTQLFGKMMFGVERGLRVNAMVQTLQVE